MINLKTKQKKKKKKKKKKKSIFECAIQIKFIIGTRLKDDYLLQANGCHEKVAIREN